MPDFAKSESLGAASLGILAIAGVVFWVRLRRAKKPTLEQLEAHRRQWLAQHGKLSGGEIVELEDGSLSYCYNVRGINYTATQDITRLAAYLPEDRWSIIGGVGVRYDPRNPANSIVLCETWTGLRKSDRASS